MPFKVKKSNVWQFDFVVGGRRFRGSLGTEDLAEAKLIEARLKLDAAKAPVNSGRFTVSQALGTYWSDVCEHQPSARVAMSQGRMILEIIDGSIETGSLTTEHLQTLINKSRRAGLSPATINRRIDMLSRSLAHMHRTRGAALPSIDFRKLRLKEPQERVRELSFEEQDALLSELRWDLQPLVLFSLMTGARLATAAGLTWRAVDFRHGRINMIVKGDKRQSFPMSPEIRNLLQSVPRSSDPDIGRFVFLYRDRSRRGMPLTPITPTGGGLMADFRESLKRAKIDGFRFHDLRHTFATRLLRKTNNLKVVSRLLGHSSIETTMRYAHVLEEDLSNALRDFSFSPQTSPQINPADLAK